MRLTLPAILLLLCAADAFGGSFLYVSASGENRIMLFKRNPEDGSLLYQQDFNAERSPGPLAVDPDQRFLFASLRGTNSLASFRLNPETGGLALIGAVPAGGSAAYVRTDQTGRYLFSAYYSEGKIAVHAIGRDGMLSKEPIQTIPTAEKAHAILIDAANRHVYVPHTGPNAIFQFLFDESTGKLTPNDPPKVTTPEGTEPRHLWFHPSGRFAYVDNEKGSSVTVFRVDSDGGALSPLQTLSTLPEGYSGRNTCADIEVHPSGRFVYASNRGHDSIAGFAIDPETGRMTSLGQFPTEETPRSFNIDPAGRFLYAAGQRNGKLAAYEINGKTGRLNRFATYPAGRNPSWVQVVDFAR